MHKNSVQTWPQSQAATGGASVNMFLGGIVDPTARALTWHMNLCFSLPLTIHIQSKGAGLTIFILFTSFFFFGGWLLS